MIRLTMTGVVVTLLLASTPLSAGSKIALVDGGKARYTIVTSTEASGPEQFAAKELADYLGKVYRLTFPVVTDKDTVPGLRLVVGPGALSRSLLGNELLKKLGPEEYVIRQTGDDIVLAGGRPRGTLYAVYSFLEEELGCQWLSLFGDEYVPDRAEATPGVWRTILNLLGPGQGGIPLRTRQEKPAFAKRELYISTRGDDPRVLSSFLIHNRENCHAINSANIVRLGEPSFPVLWPSCQNFFTFIPAGKNKPNWPAYFTPDQYFTNHPEYFSLIGDKRVPNYQLCLSNAGLRKELTRKIMVNIAHNRGTGVYAVEPDDVATGALCQCPDCKKIAARLRTPGGPLFDYLTELAPRVREQFPKAFLLTIAYRKTQTEPPPVGLKFPDNVIVRFAPIDANFGAPLEHVSNSNTLENLKGWASVTRHLWIWYYSNPYTDQGPLPIGNFHRLTTDFRLFKQLGVEGFFVEHDSGIRQSHLFSDMQSWWIARLMWNPDLDEQSALQRYMELYYGPAAPFIGQYFALLEEKTASMTTPMRRWDPPANEYHFLTAQVLLQAQELFDRAATAVAGQPVFLSRVQQARMSLDRACLVFWTSRLVSAGPLPFTRAALIERYRRTWDDVFTGKRCLSVGSTSKASYVDDFLKTLEKKIPSCQLPPPLDKVPAGKVRQVPAFFASKSRHVSVQDDPRAATGIAVVYAYDVEEGKLPLTLGLYDLTANKTVITKQITKEQIKTGDYGLYSIGAARLDGECFVWFTNTQRLYIPASECLDPAKPDQRWDIYASFRLEGPAFPHGGEGTTNQIWVDRLILISK